MSDQKNTPIVVRASVRKQEKHKQQNKSKHKHQNLLHSSSNLSPSPIKFTNVARTGYRSASRQSRLTKNFKDSTVNAANVCRCLAGYEENEGKTCLKIENKKTTPSPVLIASANSINEQYLPRPLMSPSSNEFFNSSLSPISIGKKCKNSNECKLRDPYSHCVNGVCDCIKRSSKCSAQNTGCVDSTFQCRDGSLCISWFFVCDKQKSKRKFGFQKDENNILI